VLHYPQAIARTLPLQVTVTVTVMGYSVISEYKFSYYCDIFQVPGSLTSPYLSFHTNFNHAAEKNQEFSQTKIRKP
jgi:hypothetical protein